MDDRATTPETFGPLHERFGFTVDVAAAAHNTKCERFFSIDEDGLQQPWAGERVWCNPPYSNIGPWIEKAWQEFSPEWKGCTCPGGDSCGGFACEPKPAELVVLLVPANRTEQTWWQEMVEPYRDRPDSPLRVEFLKGRLRFIAAGKTEVGPNERPPFGCCLLIFDRTTVSRARALEAVTSHKEKAS